MAALLDFGKHKGKELGSVPTSYLKWIVKELPQAKLVGWKVLAQEVLKERLRDQDGAESVDLLKDVPTLEASKTVIPFGKHKGKELGQVSTSYLKWMATELTDGNRALWGLVARSILDERASSASSSSSSIADRHHLLGLMEARRTSKHDISAEFGIEATEPLDSTTYATLLRQCIKSKSLDKGKLLHTRILEQGYSRNTFLANLVVQMYGTCGAVEQARAAFDAIQEPNSFSWNVMLAAYAQNGHLDDASRIYQTMPEKDVVARTMMITAYAQNGELQRAREIFDSMEEKNVISWTAMIAAYGKNGEVEEARRLFDQVKKPNQVTWNTMISAYALNGHLLKARDLLEEMPEQTISSWNTIISGYARQGLIEEAREVFDEMPKRDFISWNTMITAYAQSGKLQEAKMLFESTRMQHVGSWNAMIAAYAAENQPREAMELHWRMNLLGVRSDGGTIAGILAACSSLSGVRSIHAMVRAESSSSIDRFVNAALVNAYGRFGDLDAAMLVFHGLADRRVAATWNAAIGATAVSGKMNEALGLFYEMNLEGVVPCDESLTTAMCVCNEMGSRDEGLRILSSLLGGDFDSSPAVEHYLCAVAILARSGKLEEAEEVATSMPFETPLIAWTAIVDACKAHKNTSVAKRAAAAASRFRKRA